MDLPDSPAAEPVAPASPMGTPPEHTRVSEPSNGPDYCMECSREVMAYVKWPCRISGLEALVIELGRHLTALCNHPVNWENRYDVGAGRPCTGCYDARDRYAAWTELNAQDAGASSATSDGSGK